MTKIIPERGFKTLIGRNSATEEPIRTEAPSTTRKPIITPTNSSL
jgi:hypothetical protein